MFFLKTSVDLFPRLFWPEVEGLNSLRVDQWFARVLGFAV